MLSCRELIELSTEAREGLLRGAARWRYRLHLTMCPGCKSYVRGLEGVDRVLHDFPPSVAPDDVRTAALEALRAKRSRL